MNATVDTAAGTGVTRAMVAIANYLATEGLPDPAYVTVNAFETSRGAEHGATIHVHSKEDLDIWAESLGGVVRMESAGRRPWLEVNGTIVFPHQSGRIDLTVLYFPESGGRL